MGSRSQRPVLHEAEGEDTKGDLTRRHIKRVIAELASERDIADVTLADICAAAQLTTGAVYFHFGGKDEAIEEMVMDEMAKLYVQARDLSGRTFSEYVDGIILLIAKYLTSNKKLPRSLYSIIGSRRNVGKSWLKARQPVVDRLRDFIIDTRDKLGLSVESAPFLAHFILNSIEDLSMDAFQWNNPTLSMFGENLEEWRKRQTTLWSWAILTPFEDRSPNAGKDATILNRRPKRVSGPK